MDVLIRRAGQSGTDDEALVDRAVETPSLTIGSGVDQGLHLADPTVAEQHAVISDSKGIVLSCRRGQNIRHNDQTVQSARLVDGDVLHIGEHRLEVGTPPTGFDLLLTVVLDLEESAPVIATGSTSLGDTWLAPRMTTWILVALVLAAALIIPIGYHLQSDRDQAWLLDDSIWTSGPLHEAHAALESDCRACHTQLFQRVRNETCENCHADSADHVVAVNENAHHDLTFNGRCASCHLEHNEPVSTLVDSRIAVCTDCHAGHTLESRDGTLAEVADFSADGHPDFRVSVLRWSESSSLAPDTGGGKPRSPSGWSLERLPLDQASESSGLEFNHAVHADPNAVSWANGDAPACADCHRPAIDGEHFEAMSFETDCASSGCHQLELDKNNRIPHGQPDIAIAAIEGYYLKKFGDPGAEDGEAPTADRRRRPGRSDDDADEGFFRCNERGYDCAVGLAARKVDQQFTRTGCVTCHGVEAADGETPWRIVPVSLNEDYHPQARFDHAAHAVLIEPGSEQLTRDDAACVHCHESTESEQSSDVLMPAIDTCTACHDGQTRVLNVPLGCVDCHDYHPASSVSKGRVDS